jgi:uncharacterized protein YndB with AHSA1/START domain
MEEGKAMSEQVGSAAGKHNRTSIERCADSEFVATRLIDAPPDAVFRAWSRPELFQRWWVPRSVPGMVLVSCDLDVRTSGRYRLEFGMGSSDRMAFHGRYIDVVPNHRIVWTNDEEDEGAVTTVVFEDQAGQTLLRYHEAYPSAEALEEALQGPAAALPEQFKQLEELLARTGD